MGLTAMPAQASLYGCPSGYGCLYSGTYFGGEMGKWAGNNGNLANFSASSCPYGNWGGCNTSLVNNGTTCNMTWYKGTGYTGAGYNANRGSVTKYFASYWYHTFYSDLWCTY